MVTYRNTTAQETVHLPGAPQDLVDVHRDLGFVLDVDGFWDAPSQVNHAVL